MRLVQRFRALRRWQKLALIGGALVVAFAVFAYFWLFADLPSINQLQAGMALPSTRIYDRNGKLLYEILADSQTSGRNTAIPLDSIPKECQQAVISTEDANFYSHPGVDIVGIIRALWINLRGGEVVAGGSTITQQVARNLLLDPEQRAERTIQRKLREGDPGAGTAKRLQQGRHPRALPEPVLFRQPRLRHRGGGARLFRQVRAGFVAGRVRAARRAAAIAVGLRSADQPANRPRPSGGSARPDGARRRITQAQAEAAKRDALQFAASPFPIEAPHFVMAVIKQLERDYPDPLYHDGLDVVTTVDLDWQQAAERLRSAPPGRTQPPDDTPGKIPANATDAALVAMDPYTGQMLTMLGSPDYFDESIDGAVNAALAMRQPGSALKPFTYAAAMNPDQPDPWTAATMILDVATPFVTRKLESYTPANFGLVEHGPVTIREALASSFNIPAVVTLDHVGIKAMVEIAAERRADHAGGEHQR